MIPAPNAGPGQSNIINPNNQVTDINVTAPGIYKYLFTEDYKGCISKDTVEITHWDSPDFTNSKLPECDQTPEYFRIQVDVEYGDKSSWTVDAYTPVRGVLSGNFISTNTWQTD